MVESAFSALFACVPRASQRRESGPVELVLYLRYPLCQLPCPVIIVPKTEQSQVGSLSAGSSLLCWERWDEHTPLFLASLHHAV